MNPIRLGFFSFTEITDPEQHRSYNDWRRSGRIPDFRKKLKTLFVGPLESITAWQWDWFDDPSP